MAPASLEGIQDKVEQLINLVRLLTELYRAIPGERIVVTGGLSDIDSNLGIVQAGEFRVGEGEPGSANNPFTGARIAFPSMSYEGQMWTIVGLLDDVLQFGLSATTGAALFGGGAAFLDAEGLRILDANDNPVLIALSQDATINGEALQQGDVLIGDNSSGKPNMLWDQSLGKLFSRTGTIAAGEISGGTFQQYGVSVLGKGSGTTNVIPGDDSNNTVEFDHDTNQERYDDAGFFDPASPTQIVIPTGFGGRYLIGGGGGWDDGSGWAGRGHFHISINGVEPFSPTDTVDASIVTDHSAVHERELDAGDVVRLRVRQDSGSNQEFRFAYLWMHKTR